MNKIILSYGIFRDSHGWTVIEAFEFDEFDNPTQWRIRCVNAIMSKEDGQFNYDHRKTVFDKQYRFDTSDEAEITWNRFYPERKVKTAV